MAEIVVTMNMISAGNPTAYTSPCSSLYSLYPTIERVRRLRLEERMEKPREAIKRALGFSPAAAKARQPEEIKMAKMDMVITPMRQISL